MPNCYQLAAPGIAYSAFAKSAPSHFVSGTLCDTKQQAETLLADRIENGEAFVGEFVVRVPVVSRRKRYAQQRARELDVMQSRGEI